MREENPIAAAGIGGRSDVIAVSATSLQKVSLQPRRTL
jgi:hypothetical protein